MIPVTATLALDERDLEERFIRAAGPGGQNVNKVSTAVELRFQLGGHTQLPDDVRARLEKRAGRRLTLEGEIVIRAAGPGGQNVNKVSTAVELRFQVGGHTQLPDDVRARLEKLAGRRLTLEGEIVIRADEHRTQDRNRSEALARLVALVEQASHRPKPRHKTRVPKGERQRRLDHKKRRGDVKAGRGRPRDHD